MPTTKYIWDGDNILAETDGADVVQTVYTHEPPASGDAAAPAPGFGRLISTRQSGATAFHHYDGLGSTRQLTNAAGTVTDTYVFDAWGNQVSHTGTSTNPFLWIGELGYYWDSEVGSYSVRRRPYRPTIGRWTTVDPLEMIDALTRFLYALNSPLVWVDASGTYCAPTKPTKKQCDKCIKNWQDKDTTLTAIYNELTEKGKLWGRNYKKGCKPYIVCCDIVEKKSPCDKCKPDGVLGKFLADKDNTIVLCFPRFPDLADDRVRSVHSN